MKKYISLALIWSFCLLAFSACESYLEEMPQNKLMPTTTDDYDQLLNNAYITERVMPYLDILSDDVELIASNHVLDGEDEGDWQVAAYMWRDRHDLTMSGGDLAFEKLYESIYYCNVVIENIGEADGERGADSQKYRGRGSLLAGVFLFLFGQSLRHGLRSGNLCDRPRSSYQ